MTLKIRLRPFRTHTRSRTIEEPTRDPERVRSVARELLAEFELDAPVRLLGIGVGGLVAVLRRPARAPSAAAPAAGRPALDLSGARPDASSVRRFGPWPTGTG